MTRLAPAVAVLLCASLIGCNSSPLAVANRAEDVLTAVIQVASAETPAIPVSDQPAYTNFVNLAKTLDNQLSVCIAGVSGLTGQGAKFAACFTAFASGLFSPTELQQLRILNPATQNKIQLYATAVVTGLNVALAFFGSTVVSPPAIGTPPTSAEMRQLKIQVSSYVQVGY